MIFSIRDLSFELGSMLLEGWPAFAARAVCALLILLAAWLVRRWLTHKGFPALEARSWHFTGTPILLRSFAVPVQRMCTVVGIYLAASSLPWAIPGVRKLFLMAFQLVMTLLVCEGLYAASELADLVLDRACYQEMGALARKSGSEFLQGYVRLTIDVANLRTAVRCARLEKDSEFVSRVLLPGGNVSQRSIAAAKGEGLKDLFQTGLLAQAAALGSKLAQPGAGALTAFEAMCDDAVTAYLSSAKRIPFGEQTVIGYLYAKEAELTTVRTIMSGRMAGLDGDTIRSRLRAAYV